MAYLETKRTQLDLLDSENIEFVTEVLQKYDTRDLVGEDKIPQSSRGIQTRVKNSADTSDNIHLVIRKKSSEEHIGKVHVLSIDPINADADISGWVIPSEREEGYATEVLQRLIKHSLHELRLNRVSSWAYEYNDASIQLMESVGFKKEGVSRQSHFSDGQYWDIHHYGLLEEEWR